MMSEHSFGHFVRESRIGREDADYSLRKLAGRVGIEPSYLSKIERGVEPPPGEKTVRSLAKELGEDPDVLLAMAGKVPNDLLDIIRARPRLFADLLREVGALPDHAVLRLVRAARGGDW